MRLTKNFSLSEFDCNDGTEMPSELLTNVLELAENLQVLRVLVIMQRSVGQRIANIYLLKLLTSLLNLKVLNK